MPNVVAIAAFKISLSEKVGHLFQREHAIFWMLLLRNSFVPKRDIAVKLLSHKLGSIGMLVLYGITMGGEESIDVKASLARAGLSISSWEACGGCEGGKVKLYKGVFDNEGGI